MTDTHTFNDSVVAGKIMDLLGVAHEVSMEPGVDRLRDSVAELIRQHIESTNLIAKSSLELAKDHHEKFDDPHYCLDYVMECVEMALEKM